MRIALGVFVCVAFAGGSLALAQPSGKKGGKPPSPPIAEAGASDAGPSSDAAPALEPIRTDWDAAAKLSPLTPTPGEFPQGGVDGGAAPQDYDKLIADVASLRARVATLSDGLFRSRLAIAIETDGDKTKLAKLTVSVDDGVVYSAPAGFRAEDFTPVFEHAIAPGKHAITIEAERADAKDESFKTIDRTRFTVDVPKDQRLAVDVRIGDDSTMGADFPSDRAGKYDLRFRVKAVAKGGK
jgi:hypothetical protein